MYEPFRATPLLRLHGDAGRALALRGRAMAELGTLARLNLQDLAVASRTVTAADGTRIVCRRVGGLDLVDVLAPVVRDRERAGPVGPPAVRPEPGTFYVLSGCRARYDGLGTLANAIPDGPLASWSLGHGAAVTTLPAAAAGLPGPAAEPETGTARQVRVFSLPGGADSGLVFGPGHIPAQGAFSVSCLVRLTAPLEYDYTFDERGVLSPIRPYLLETADGAAFTRRCPGGLSPLLGLAAPRPNPDWTESVAYPWPPYTEDFQSRREYLVGALPLSESCPGAPLLEGPAGGPYRDASGRPYPHPHGLAMGQEALGLFLLGPDRLMAVRRSDFARQKGFAPLVSGPLAMGVWHHALMSHEADGSTRLHLSRLDANEDLAFSGPQPTGALSGAFGHVFAGINAWTLYSSASGEKIGHYRMNAAMDVALPRFYHRALGPEEAWLLRLEASGALFVADDHEIGALMDKGARPIIIGRNA